jgi:hypothetical protein
MPTGCEFPMIKTFENALTAADFESTVELTNFPAVFRGCASVWDAYSKWNPFNSGLDYLEVLFLVLTPHLISTDFVSFFW